MSKAHNWITLQKKQRLYTATNVRTNFVYLSEAGRQNNHRVLRVQCDCGRKKSVKLINIRSGKSTTCGFSPCRIPSNAGSRKEHVGEKCLFGRYGYGARKRGLNFELSFEQFLKLIKQNCFYCDDPPSNTYRLLDSRGNIRAGVPFTYNGIDRKKSDEGYTKENTVSCCWKCNVAKSHFDIDVFLSQVRKIYLKNFK